MGRNEASCNCNIVHEEAVKRAREAMLPDGELAELSEFFKILGDATRIRIMWALDRTELCVCDIAAVLGMTKSAVSHQLNRLRRAKLVKYRRDGKNVYYSLDDEHVSSIVELAIAHLAHE